MVYFDSSAIIWLYGRGRLDEISGLTRPHALAEVFSALTGKGFISVAADGTARRRKLSLVLAAAVIASFEPRLDYVELSPGEVMDAIRSAKTKNAQGGRIHDLLHAVAAD